MELELPILIFGLLLLTAFAAGFVDAVAGGGGLLQLPALVLLAPQYALPTLFGTNKLASIAGTSFSLYRYSRKIEIPWRLVWPAALAAFGGSYLGAHFVVRFPAELLEIVILVLLFLVSLYTLLSKEFGLKEKLQSRRRRHQLAAIGVGFVLGFYDGFFGPGTGGFLIFLFVLCLGMNFLGASASAKAVNVATNLAALIYFIPTGHVLWLLGLSMAACNVLGASLGSHMALSRGSIWVRRIFLLVVFGLQVRLAWGLISS